MATATAASRGGEYAFLLVANRLPVDQVDTSDGRRSGWRRSPGGLVTALEPMVRATGGAWLGWSGSAGAALEPFDADGVRLVPVPMSAEEVEHCYEGFANATLWPLYHDVIVAPQFHRHWWDAYVTVNQRFAMIAARHAGDGATVWVHDYQLQLVPSMLRWLRPNLRIGFFNHIPFPGYEIFAQLPWRRRIVSGLLGADLIGFQRTADATNFLRACRRAAGLITRGDIVSVVERPWLDSPTPGRVSAPTSHRGEESGRPTRVGAFPISIDTPSVDHLARTSKVQARAGQIRGELGDPEIVLLGVDRLDYTKGILHRLKAYEELLDSGQLGPPRTVFVQVASPSRERVEDYQILRDDVERLVGRINGNHSTLGQPAIQYLHHSYSQDEMAALYRAADVMLVTPLRDGMNLVAKEYVACRHDESGALVLSEFTGAADELGNAFLVNPHDIDGLKSTILRAVHITPGEARRRMRSMRKRVRTHDVNWWATSFLEALHTAPHHPAPEALAPA